MVPDTPERMVAKVIVKDIYANFVVIDFKPRKEVKHNYRNKSGISTREVNKHWRSYKKNTTKVMFGYANNLITMS